MRIKEHSSVLPFLTGSHEKEFWLRMTKTLLKVLFWNLFLKSTIEVVSLNVFPAAFKRRECGILCEVDVDDAGHIRTQNGAYATNFVTLDVLKEWNKTRRKAGYSLKICHWFWCEGLQKLARDLKRVIELADVWDARRKRQSESRKFWRDVGPMRMRVRE